MRPHHLDRKTSNCKSPNGLQKPVFSQLPKYQNFTLEGMPVKYSPCAHPQRVRQTQGIALVVVLLSAMILMVSMLAITSTMVISSQRTTADQASTLQSQYAAEAGLARGHVRLNEAQTYMNRLNITNSTRTQIENHAKNYCNGGQWTPAPTDKSTWTADQQTNGFPLCLVGTSNLSNRYSIFTGYSLRADPLTGATTYPDGVSATTFWDSVFSKTPASTKIATDSANGSESWYTLTHGLTSTRVLLVDNNFYRFEFTVAATQSTGDVRVSNRVVATRRVQQQTDGTYSFTIQVPSYARNHIFRYETTDITGGALSFAGGETFNGPVHTNEQPNFSKSNGQTPVFNSDFSTCAPNGTFYGYGSSTYTATSASSEEMKGTFKGSAPLFGLAPCPELPTNSNNQKRASFGGDPNNKDTLTDEEMQAAWGLRMTTTTSQQNWVFIDSNNCRNNPYQTRCWRQETTTTTQAAPLPDGVYYSKGDGASNPNQAASWNNDPTRNIGGGMYIKGDVGELKFSTGSGRQVISVRQGTATTTFTENANGTWTVRVNGTSTNTLSGKFNGMIYVDGNVNDLRGDGTNAADVALNSKLMVASTGKVVIKESITYTQVPTASSKSMANVLGIYSSGEKCEPVSSSAAGCGSVLVDGQNNKDIDLHASIMATKNIAQGNRKGEGFGSVKYNQNLGLFDGRKVRINLLGGIIERQSQTVSSGSGGYNRNYNYDLRFADGFAPPFFPEQAEGGESAVVARWTTTTSPFGSVQGVWQTVGN